MLMYIIFGAIIGGVFVFLWACASVEKLAGERALEKVEQAREEFDQNLSKFRKEWEVEKKAALKSSHAVIKGNIIEQMVPFLAEWSDGMSDARFLGSPIDYVLFKNYSKLNSGDESKPLEIVFAEVKSGNSQLSHGEELIKEAIEKKRVSWEEIRI